MKKLILCSSLILLSACGKRNIELDVKGVIPDQEHTKVINTVAYMFDNYFVHDKGVDGSAEVRKINNTFAKELFYNKIEEVFFRQKDFHTQFIKPTKCFSVGVHIKNLSFDIADENGRKKIVVSSLNSSKDSHNIINSNNFSAYYDALAQLQVGDVITEINDVNVLQALKNIEPISFGANKDAK